MAVRTTPETHLNGAGPGVFNPAVVANDRPTSLHRSIRTGNQHHALPSGVRGKVHQTNNKYQQQVFRREGVAQGQKNNRRTNAKSAPETEEPQELRVAPAKNDRLGRIDITYGWRSSTALGLLRLWL